MENLDFTKASHCPIYDPAVATAFFKQQGVAEEIETGKVFFKEREQRSLFANDDRMYLLLDGTVVLTLEGKPIDTVKPGEIFGELASLTRARRSATAVAKSDCRVIALDSSQFEKAMADNPSFALMLMSIMINRLRLTLARLVMRKKLSETKERSTRRVFDDETLDKVSEMLDHPQLLRFSEKQVIVDEGDAGTFMYFPREGCVAITSDGHAIEYVGVGSAFGEMALVDGSKRCAKAVAASDCALLAVNRKQFLQLVKSNPEFGLSLLKMLAHRLQAVTALSAK